MGIMAICDRDESYVRCFTDYFSGNRRIPFSVYGFSKERELLQFIKQSKVEILLISAKMLSEKICDSEIKKIIVLSDGEMLCEGVSAPAYDTIFKFQSTENIIREVMEIYSGMNMSELTDMMPASINSAVWGVYSPVARCGKTTFAITLGQILAKEERVLYIDMDEFSGFGALCGREFSGDLSDVLYYQKLNPAGLNVKLRAIVNNIHGLDVVAPMSYSSDLRDIGASQWNELIDYILCKCEYEKIILDINSTVKNPVDMLSMCDRIYMPVADDVISNAKVREFEHYLIQRGKEQILFKIEKIKVPKLKEGFVQSGYIEQLILSNIGEYVEGLLRGGDENGKGGNVQTGYISDRAADGYW